MGGSIEGRIEGQASGRNFCRWATMEGGQRLLYCAREDVA
jgi:hypothetical protein